MRAEYDLIPMTTLESLDGYLREGYVPGGFLLAVLENNLKQSIQNADEYNLAGLIELVRYLYNVVPYAAWGSPERVSAWLRITPEERGTMYLALQTHRAYLERRSKERAS